MTVHAQSFDTKGNAITDRNVRAMSRCFAVLYSAALLADALPLDPSQIDTGLFMESCIDFLHTLRAQSGGQSKNLLADLEILARKVGCSLTPITATGGKADA